MANKTTIWVISILLAICSICAGWGFYMHDYFIKNPIPENKNKEFKFYNRLYFYDQSGNELGVYPCNFDYCDYAETTIDDDIVNTNYYKKATKSSTGLINNRYAFINDNLSKGVDSIILYDVVNQKKVYDLSAVKTYSIGLDNDLFIVKDLEGKWGVVKLTNNAGTVIDIKYDYVGVNSEIDEQTGYLGGELNDALGTAQALESDTEGDEIE